jgi:superfamily II DNA or RNA helicase
VESDLAKKMDTDILVGDVVTNWFKLAERRKTVVFATNVAHSVHLRNEFLRAGVLAEHIDGSMPVEERDRVLARLASGDIELVVNCAVLTEGWDSPAVSCLVLARPTKSLALYRQMVGRVLRPAPGKTDALVIDHAGAIFEHGFVEEPITWALSEDRRAENQTQTSRRKGKKPQLVECPECKAVNWQGQACSACGWRPRPKPAAVDVVDGELSQVMRDRSLKPDDYPVAAKIQFYRQLLYIANERGYQRGWAAHKYKEKFGDWPPVRSAHPMTPNDEVRSWVKARQIAWVKAREKASAA